MLKKTVDIFFYMVYSYIINKEQLTKEKEISKCT